MPSNAGGQDGDPARADLVTLPSLADRLGITPRSVQRRARRLRLVPVRTVRGVGYYSAAQVDLLVANPHLPFGGDPDGDVTTTSLLLDALDAAQRSMLEERQARIDDLQTQIEQAAEVHARVLNAATQMQTILSDAVRRLEETERRLRGAVDAVEESATKLYAATENHS